MTFLSVLRAETTKTLSLRSTRWTMLAMLVVVIGLGVLVCLVVSNTYHPDAGDTSRPEATEASLVGIVFGQVAIAVLGVLTIRAEYGNGAIRATFTAVPRRGLVVAAKAVVVLGVGLAFGWVGAFGAFLLGRPFLDHVGLGASLGDPGVLRAVLGAGLYLAASGLFGFALGALLRSTAGAIVAAVIGLLALPIPFAFVPGSTGETIRKYLPSNAGGQIITVHGDSTALGPWTGFAVFCLWWAVILAGASVLVHRRDA